MSGRVPPGTANTSRVRHVGDSIDWRPIPNGDCQCSDCWWDAQQSTIPNSSAVFARCRDGVWRDTTSRTRRLADQVPAELDPEQTAPGTDCYTASRSGRRT